jgi:hypothetical protein
MWNPEPLTALTFYMGLAVPVSTAAAAVSVDGLGLTLYEYILA